MTKKAARGHTIPDNDGWTLPGFIQGIEGLHDDLKFTYRPYQALERSAIVASLDGKGNVEAEKILFLALSKRLKSWNVKESDQSLPITPDTIRTLYPALLSRLNSIVIYGSQGSDIDPDWSKEDADAQVQANLDAALSGRLKGDQLTENLAKN